MKKLIFLLLTMAFAVTAQDFTTTPNLGLKLPKQGSTNWGPYVNQDFTTLDAAIGAFHGGFSTVPFSPTPVFNLTLGNTFQLTLSGNVSSSSVNQPGIISGQIMYLIICQDSTGGRSFVFPPNFQAPLPVVTTNAGQCSATTWIWSAPLHQWVSTGGGSSGGGGGGGNSALKPAPADGIRYVTKEGNDANDGLSWGTAKLTPYAALLSLPNGAVSPPTAGNGVVYVANDLNGINFGGPVAANLGGWWMFGPGDPGYAGGVTGWMRVPTAGTVTMECAAPTAGVIHEGGAVCQEFWGGHADNVHPAVWFSSFSSQAVLRGFAFNYEATGFKIGIDSTNNRSVSTGVSSILLDHDQVNFGGCYSGVGAGPAIDIGGASFWINITRGSYSGCTTQDYSISSIARASNVVTVTLTASGTGDIVSDGTAKIIIRNVTDTSFDGAYVMTSASGSTLTFAQTGPDATSSGGQAFPYGAAAIGINSGSGPGAGFVYVDDTAVNGGGIWAQGGFNGVGLSANKIVYEGSGLPDMSTIEFVASNGFGDTSVYVNDVQPADTTVPICGVESFVVGAISASNASVCGSLTTLNGSITGSVSPLNQGTYGVYNKHTISINSNSARRMFSPYAVRGANQVGLASGWTTTGLTATGGVLAPDGTTGATSLANATGSNILMNFGGFFSGATPNIGDYYIYGVWLRSETAGSGPLGPNFNLNSSGLGAGDYCRGNYLSGQGVSSLGANVSAPSITGDKEWGYWSGVCKIITNPSGGNQRLDMNVAANTTIDAYGPVLTLIPAGSISTNEAFELANNLQSYPKAAVAGDVSMFPGQQFDMSVSGSNFMYLHQGAPTATRTITWPDATFTVPAPNVSNTWSANQTFTNGTELRFLSSNATNYAGFKGGASTTNLVWLFPTTDASGTQCLSSNGSLQLAWSACSAGTGTPGGANTNIQYNSSGSFAGSGNLTFDGTGLVGIGLANTTLGKLKLFGSTSGDVTLQPQAVAGTATVLTAPNTTGTLADGATSPLALSATTGNLTCATCTTNAAALTANQLVIGGGSQAAATLGTLGTTTTLLHGNAGGAPTFAAASLTADVTGTLPIANGGTGQTTKAAAFDALSPNTTQGDLTVFGASSNGRLPVGANGTCLVSNGTTVAYGSCASGSVSGNAVSGQGTFWNGTATLGGSVNWLYSAATGHSVIQGANNTDLLYGHRFTDSAPTGNFLHFQNAAANADVAKLDVLGNLTVTSVNFNGTGAAGTVNLFQGTAPALIANTVQLSAPASVAAGGIQFIYPGTPSSGFIRWTNLTGTETGSLVPASGTGSCAGGAYVTGLNDNAAPTCSPLVPGGFGSQTANTVLAAPSGSAGLPTFRALVAADIPTLSLSGGGFSGTLPIANGGTNATTASAGFNNLSPLTTAGDILYGGASGAGTRLAAGSATTVLHSGTTPSWSAVSMSADVTGTLPIANGGTGQTTAGPAFNALAPTASANAVLYATGSNTWGSLAASGAGVNCLQENNGGTPAWSSCGGGGGGSTWDTIGNPLGNLVLSMGTNTSSFTSGVYTGSSKGWDYSDGNSTSVVPFFTIHTGASSTMPPFQVTAQGTSNGVQVDTTGNLGIVGTGNITSTKLSRTITTTTPLTIGGGSSADLTTNRTLACPTCVTSASALTDNGVVIGSGGGQGTASTVAGTAGQLLFGSATSPAFAGLHVTNAKTATYQVLAADFAGYKTIPVASGTFTITLVASGSQPASGQSIDVINYGSGVVTIARSGQLVNGVAGNIILPAGSSGSPTGAHVVSDGTNYVIEPFALGTGVTVQVNGSSTGISSNANFNNTTPAAPVGADASNVTWPAPSGSSISGYVQNFLPTSTAGRWGTQVWSHANGGVNSVGAFVGAGGDICTTPGDLAATTSNPSYKTCGTGATANTTQYLGIANGDTAIGNSSNPNNLHISTFAKMSATTATRAWMAEISDAGTLAPGTSDSPTTLNFAGIRFSSVAGDTNYMLVLCNAAACNATSTGVAADTAKHHFEVRMNDVAGSAQGCVDGTCVSSSTDYPNAAVTGAFGLGLIFDNTTTTVETLSWSGTTVTTVN